MEEFILEQLETHGVHVADSSANNIKAYCYNGHDSKSPSLSIRKTDGTFYCFGCGESGYGWNALAEKIGAKKLKEEELPDPLYVLYKQLSAQEENTKDANIVLPWDAEPWTLGKYRGLSPGFLKRLDAKHWYDSGVRAYRILFPISQKKKLLGWVARRLDKIDDMKYRNAPKMRAMDILYPFDFVHQYFDSPSIVLVEGPMDALRLCHFQLPALAIMGTNNWRKKNRSLLLSLDVEKVVICTDGDPAGLKCRGDITPDLEEWFDVEHYFPPEGDDPGGMERKYVEELRKLL